VIGVRHSFDEGALVRHRRYGYRGVVVAFDACCRADDAWYGANRTQPDRNQPWYHVLVDGAAHATYAAQENLERDPAGRPVEHPLVSRFFSAFQHGAYVRNDEPWPAWS
jgi:heat shock protein HspQ